MGIGAGGGGLSGGAGLGCFLVFRGGGAWCGLVWWCGGAGWRVGFGGWVLCRGVVFRGLCELRGGWGGGSLWGGV